MNEQPNEAWVYLVEGQYTRSQIEQLIKMFDLQDKHIAEDLKARNE